VNLYSYFVVVVVTTYKHVRAITIDMRYKIRLSAVQTTLWSTPALSYHNKQKCRKSTLLRSPCSPWKVYILAYFIDTSSTPQMINQYCGRPMSQYAVSQNRCEHSVVLLTTVSMFGPSRILD